MKIQEIELREIHLDLSEPFEISSGSRQHRRILLLRMSGEGHTGWGECVAAEDPGYSYETTDTAWHILMDFLLPAIVGKDFADADALLAPLKWVRGHRMAKAAAEMAFRDLDAKAKGVSLAAALAAESGAEAECPLPESVAVGVSVGLQPSVDHLIRKVEGYLEEGYARIKIKIKPGRDVEMLAAVRKRFPEIAMMADANSAYTLADAPRLLELDALGLTMIEQPLAHDDFFEHARLQEQMRTPICLDESICSEGDALLALELGSCRVINIKPGRVGGLGESRRIHDACRNAGIPVWCGGMLESGIGRAHNVALATLPNFLLPGDISSSRRYWDRDIIEPEFEMKGGRMAVPAGHGIGVTPDRERIDSLTRRIEVAGA